MRALDRWTMEHGTPGHVLMGRAGAGAARALCERLHRPRGPVVVVCGRGNNGGDGFVLARHLRRRHVPVEVWLAARPEEVRGDAARMLAAWRRARGRIHPLGTAADAGALARRLAVAAAVVDALFGTGLNAPVAGVAGAAVEAINACGAPVPAVDIASGLSADPGRPLLAAGGAARAGAGLTTLAVPATLQPVLEAQVREAMTAALPDTSDGAALDALLAGRAAVVCGPGLGQAAETRALVAHVIRRSAAPLVLDADGLNAVAGTGLLRARAGPTVVTPHPGEMARLLGADTARVQADRLGAARAFACAERVVVVLKGARTIVAAPDGAGAICPAGNPGMASGGTGDVLAGVIGGLMAQGLAPYAAASLGVFAHGASGDAVAARQGEVGLLAGDLLAELPATLARLQTAARPEAPGGRGYRAGASDDDALAGGDRGARRGARPRRPG